MPRIDADGNELDGIRSPLISAPLGTYVGWNVFAAGFEKGRFCNNIGGYIPFAATKAERLAKGDPRPSLEERYPSHAAYVAKVKAQADALVAQALHAAGRCGADRGGSRSRQDPIEKGPRRPAGFRQSNKARSTSRRPAHLPGCGAARVVLKMPQEQKRAMVSAASFGVRRFSLTKLIIFCARLMDSMPWPHMVDSMMACLPGMLSPTSSKPSE